MPVLFVYLHYRAVRARVDNVERFGVFFMERWLEVFCEYITFVVLTCDSPNPNLAVNVILSDCVMASVDGA